MPAVHRVLFLAAMEGSRRPRAACLPVATGFGILVAVLALTAQARTATAADIVVVGVPAARAEAIAAHALDVRSRAFRHLLGQETPGPWRAPCEVVVHATAADFAAAVGGPPAVARGATSIEFAGPDVVLRRIDVMGDGPEVIPDALAHELVHVVLADHFTEGPPPRWADEGLAVLFDPESKQRGHQRDFDRAAGADMAWRVRDLFALDSYPQEPGRQRIFYGQSASVVRWLVDRRGGPTFIRFLDDCAAIGPDEAVRRHYDLGSVAALERAWKEVPSIDTVGLAERFR
jgi:hypothetical protein